MGNNVTLIGMPGSGKSTVGVLLAKTLGYQFIDTDLVLQRREGALLQDILDQRGVEAFLDAEEAAVKALECTRAVIAPGGSGLSDNGIFRKRNRDGTIWSLSLSAAVFYLTPAASEGYRSTLKPEAFRGKSPSSNLSAQVIHQEQPLSEKAALNPDWVEWLMGFPKGWTAVSSGERNPQMSPA